VFLIVGIVLLLVLPSPWNVVGAVAALAAFGGEVVFWNRAVRGSKETAGVDVVLGKKGTVVVACRPEGQVRVGGENWEARCDGGANPGDTVVVVSRDGLTLVVKAVE
jgi:membrane protein implicated in regulation of membrane protease activity